MYKHTEHIPIIRYNTETCAIIDSYLYNTDNYNLYVYLCVALLPEVGLVLRTAPAIISIYVYAYIYIYIYIEREI